MKREYENIINSYIKAKDGNKPHLMKDVFSESATLTMKVQTDKISFPPEVAGVDHITEALIHKFNNSYENVYTICLADTVEQDINIINCRWLVGMTEKSSGSSRVGFGEYKWSFIDDGSSLVSHLTIIIENMVVLPIEAQREVMSWFCNLAYPWAMSSDVSTSVPDIALLSELRESFA